MQVFLSYDASDSQFAANLVKGLTGRGITVWWDQNILPGDNWADQTGQALEKSQAMIVLISPDSMRSHKVRREIDFALGNARYERRLFPVEVRPTHDAPWILQRYQILKGKHSASEVVDTLATALQRVA